MLGPTVVAAVAGAVCLSSTPSRKWERRPDLNRRSLGYEPSGDGRTPLLRSAPSWCRPRCVRRPRIYSPGCSSRCPTLELQVAPSCSKSWSSCVVSSSSAGPCAVRRVGWSRRRRDGSSTCGAGAWGRRSKKDGRNVGSVSSPTTALRRDEHHSPVWAGLVPSFCPLWCLPPLPEGSGSE